MTRRILAPEEWPRLAETPLADVWPMLQADRSRVVVVEDAEGQIVGCWAFVLMLHAEGVYIAPAHRRQGSVARQLLAGLREAAVATGSHAVWTGADDPEVARLLTRIGARSVPYESFVIPIEEGHALCQRP